MLKNDNVVSLQKNLLTGKYFQVLKDLRRIGHPVKKAWYTQRLQAGNALSENKFTTNPAFKKFLADKFQNVKLINESNDKTTQPLYELKDTLLQLTLFLMLWKDDPTSKMAPLNVSTSDKKRLRQQLKYKSHLDKDDRHDINIGLHVVTFLLCQEINNAIKQPTPQHQFDLTRRFEETRSKDDLIQFVFLQQENFNKWLSKNLNSNNEPSLLKNNPEIIEKIGKAINAFQVPNKKKKVLKYSGIALAFIAALASGLSTGAAIVLLFPSLSLTAITLGGLIALFGFTANFGFLSKNFPDFLLSLSKKGGISEYIDNNGDRKQFSTTYKYLLTPLAIFSSLTVGIGAAALTYITITGLVTTFFPILAITWPLPLIIVGILAASVGVTLTVATLTASLELLKKLARLNMSFLNLCQFASKNCIAWFKHLKNAKTHEKVGLAIMLLLLPIGLAGLAYYRYTAGIDLSIFIGLAGAIVTGLTAYMAQVAFIFLSINKLKSALMRPFSSNTIQPVVHTNDHPTNILNQTQSFLSKIWYLLGLSVNAIGNSILVYNGSSLSIAGAVACGVNSFSGNMLAPDTYQGQRNQINQFINQDYETFIAKAEPISNKSPQSTTSLSFFNLSDKKIEIKLKPNETNMGLKR